MRREPGGAASVVLHLLGTLWGLPQNVVGAAMALVLWLRGCGHSRFRLALVSEWGMDAGLSLGFFIFVPRGCARSLLVHEYGHTVQSLILGPIYLIAVVVPSLLWAGLPSADRYRRRRKVSYYAHPIEHWADLLGTRVCGERSVGLASAKARS